MNIDARPTKELQKCEIPADSREVTWVATDESGRFLKSFNNEQEAQEFQQLHASEQAAETNAKSNKHVGSATDFLKKKGLVPENLPLEQDLVEDPAVSDDSVAPDTSGSPAAADPRVDSDADVAPTTSLEPKNGEQGNTKSNTKSNTPKP